MPDDKKKKDKRSGFDFTMYRINATQGKMVVVIHVVLLVLGWTSAFLGVPLANYWLSYAGLTLLFLTYMSVLIWALILFHERAERIEKAADAFNQEVDTLETGSLERVDIASTNPALIRLQDHINRLLDSYSRYQIVFAQTAQNAETRLNLHMGYIFPRAEFIRRVNEEIQRGQAYRSALVLVRLDHEGINVQNDLQEMLEAAKEIFPGSLRGKIDPRTYGFYLFDFDSLLSLRNRCEMLVSNFYKLEIGQVNGAERSIGCRVSACVYPYVFRTELFEKAEAALDNSEEPIVIDSGSGAIYFPRVISSRPSRAASGRRRPAKRLFRSSARWWPGPPRALAARAAASSVTIPPADVTASSSKKASRRSSAAMKEG